MLDKSIDGKLPLGTFWTNNHQVRVFYNEIHVNVKGKKRGYVKVLYLHGAFEGLVLKEQTVHPDQIIDWVDPKARKEKYGI
jgi:hypothetical protein